MTQFLQHYIQYYNEKWYKFTEKEKGSIRFKLLTRMHFSRMHTTRSFTISCSIQEVVVSLWMQTPLPGCTPPGCRSSLDADPPGGRSPVNRMTHRCKNITLPQTSFAAGKNTPRNTITYNDTLSQLRHDRMLFVEQCALSRHLTLGHCLSL